MALRNWDCLPLKSPRSKSGKAFAGFRQTSSILAIYLQRRLSLFTLCSCRQRVKARPARGQIIEMDEIYWHFQQPLLRIILLKVYRISSFSVGSICLVRLLWLCGVLMLLGGDADVKSHKGEIFFAWKINHWIKMLI